MLTQIKFNVFSFKSHSCDYFNKYIYNFLYRSVFENTRVVSINEYQFKMINGTFLDITILIFLYNLFLILYDIFIT